MRSGDLESSLEPPASAFGPQLQSQQRTVPVAELQHLLGVAQPAGPSLPPSGFSSALMPGPSGNASEAKPRTGSADGSAPRPKSVRFGDAPGPSEPKQHTVAASLEEPTGADFENAQVSAMLTLLQLGSQQAI